MEFSHIPVMFSQCMELLNIKPDGIYVDCTAGGGGHSQGILDRLSLSGRLLAFDKDIEALDHCKNKFKDDKRVTLLKSDYKLAPQYLTDNSLKGKIDGILIDLGVSSFQLDNRERGFSYMSRDAALDMRMDKSQSLTAREIVNNYPQEEIYKIIKNYGEDKFAANIAKNIVIERQKQPIETTGQLADIVDKSIPYALKKTGGHPAKRTFMALRIAVNGELDNLDKAITDLIRCLKSGGRIVILTFHSLEDRIVKQTLNYLQLDCVCDKKAPICTCGKVKEIELIRKFITATEAEQLTNSRSISAKLRAAEKI